MGVSISLDFTERDLRFFRRAIRKARNTVHGGEEAEIIEAVRSALATIRARKPLPDFVAARLPELDALIDMLEDREWRLPRREREQLLATFVYFGDPEDVIPDDIPAIGFLDDLILIELLLRDFRHVREAYADFCRYRQQLGKARGDAPARDRQLTARRKELQARMKRRRARARSVILA
jgi:uncharacterized membrane protein YkvA (DUF1232 family)